jgi:hypothetical protein
MTCAGSLGQGHARRIAVMLTYASSGAIVWTPAIWLLGRLPTDVDVVILAIFAMVFGAAEVLMLPMRSPGLNWQVPARWVRSRHRALIWAVFLGPGCLTRNPYAGMWAWPLCFAIAGSSGSVVLFGALGGALHGASRGALIWRSRAQTDVYVLSQEQIMYKLRDGLILAYTLGLSVGAVISW